MKVILQHRIYRSDLRNNHNILYVFGDNEARVGLGGQAAECRGERNAAGIATLKAPGVFWSDDDFERQKSVVDADMEVLFMWPGLIVWPSDGIGTGLARLEIMSPLTMHHIRRRFQELLDAQSS